MSKRAHYDCAVIGEWHLAFITAASLSSLGNKVLLVNSSSQSWNEFPELKLNEPGLREMIQNSRARGLLDYTNGFNEDWSTDIAWLAIDTPVNERDEADVTPLREAVARLSRSGNLKGPLAISSQIPLGFSRQLQKEFQLSVCYIPENLRLSKGIETFLRADRTVIGADRPETAQKIRDLLNGVQSEFLMCDLVTSEMVKHATNIFLATSISFANELARIGESMGVDGQTVGKALKMDARIGKGAYVVPGLGFAGGTLPRDLRIVQKLGREKGIATPLVNAVLDVNESTTLALVETLKNYLGNLKGKTILLMGYAYKSDIDTLRRSPTIDLAKLLQKEGAVLLGYDSRMNKCDLSALEGLIEHRSDWEAIQQTPDAVVLMTARSEFSLLDWKNLARTLGTATAKPPLVFDTVSIVPSEAPMRAGFAYKPLWRPVRNEA